MAVPRFGNTQHQAILRAPEASRLSLFWRYCAEQFISDKDSISTHRFLNEIILGADRLKDPKLKAYAQYFQKVWRIYFSIDYEWHFPPGYLAAIDVVNSTQAWALKNGNPDIAASCDHISGIIYNRAGRYGLGSEYLLKAHDVFTKIGYNKVPNAAGYLYELALHFYRFEEYEKALQILLQATQYKFYLPRAEISALNAIALIYARKQDPAQAIVFFRNTMAKAAQYNDSAWIGIAAGNLGNVLLAGGKYDSAHFYHNINYAINSTGQSMAPEDAAKTALSIATIFLRKMQPDSALFYINSANRLSAHSIVDTTDRLEFNKRLLKVLVDYRKSMGDLPGALLLTDSLLVVEQDLRKRLDGKLLSRAMEKTEAVSYHNKIALLQSQKDLSQLRSYVVIATLLIVLLLVVLFFRDRWLREKRRMQLVAKDQKILLAEKQQTEERLNHSKELLTAYIDTIKEKTLLIEHLEDEISELKKLANHVPELETITGSREKLIASTILTDTDWQQFRAIFERVHPGFSSRLKAAYPELSPAEARLLFLTKLDLSSREMATMLGISVDSMYKLRYRLRKKLNLEEDSGFEVVLRKIDEVVPSKA
jgi:DNA-binding CsgD family transcriptional regulator